MPTIREFETQVWKLEGVRVVLRASQAHAEANHNLQPYRGYLATDDACTVRRFKARLEDYTDIPLTIVGGNGLTPSLTVTLGEIRATYSSNKGKLGLAELMQTQVALRKAAKAGALEMLDKGIPLKTIFAMDALLKDYAVDPKSVSTATWKGMAKDLRVNFLGTKNFLEWYMLARANSPITPPAETKKPATKKVK